MRLKYNEKVPSMSKECGRRLLGYCLNLAVVWTP